MFRNYFKTAIRNLLRYKGFAIINIASLTIGIIGCLVIGLFVKDELAYDKNIPGGENIYRLYDERKNDEGTTYMACTAPAYATFLNQQYPEVDTTARILMSNDKFLVEKDDKKEYESKGWFVENSFLSIFPLKFIKGNATDALVKPAAVVISEDMAARYFGKEDPIGKTIKIDKDDFEVTGVLAPLPNHFHLKFNYLMSLAAAGIPKERMEKWTWNQFYTYAKLKPGTNVDLVQEKFRDYIRKNIEKGSTSTLPVFQQLKNIHLQSSSLVYDNAERGNETYVRALTIIAFFVLAIACFNFINLATARSFRRAKEIGVRKVAGADRNQLILQFIGETVLLSLFSMIVAVVVVSFIVPAFNEFTGKSISFNPFTNPLLALVILGSGLIIGILAGIYPALVLSGFQPIKVLKSLKLAKSTGGNWLRQGLVVVQFSLSVLLIVSTLIVYKQTKYLNNKDLGFNKDQVAYFQVRGDAKKNIETFKSELKRIPGVLSVTSGYGLPGDQYAGDGVKVGDEKKDRNVNLFIGDEDYVKTLGLRIIAGRDFSRDMSTDVKEAFLINETAVKEFGFGTPEKAIGQRLNWDEWEPADTSNPVKHGKVIGVVQDFHYKNLHEKVAASVIQLYPSEVFKVAVKLGTADMKNTIAKMSATWNKFSPSYPLDYKFMDETYGVMYNSEEKLGSLLWIFTVMAIVIGCMGLFALAAFSSEQKTKEIGIRKVLGASVMNISGLLLKNFVMLVLLASLIAFPIAWWAMNDWLKDFPYRITISWWIFIIAALSAILITVLSTGLQAVKAALTNPIKSLRTE